MARVQAIHLSPVKSLRLRAVPEARIDRDGIAGDREFLLLDDENRVATQRNVGVLAQVPSHYDGTRLELQMPDGEIVSGEPAAGEIAETELWGRPITGALVVGPWNAALSRLAQRPLRLMRPAAAERGLDSHPVSVLSRAAVDALGAYAGRTGDLDARRFRPTLLITDCAAHEEDAWVGTKVRAGEAVLDVIRLDPRCVLTTRHPETGERDADTLRWIDQTRGRVDGEVCFGVYADVAQPGVVRVGDPVEPLAEQETS
jgi:uncharacterized protein YcbX